MKIFDDGMARGAVQGFGFSAVRPETLGSTEYTLVTLVFASLRCSRFEWKKSASPGSMVTYTSGKWSGRLRSSSTRSRSAPAWSPVRTWLIRPQWCEFLMTWRQPFSRVHGSTAMNALTRSGVSTPFWYQ